MKFAIDFDGTICKDNFPSIGEPIKETIRFIRDLKEREHTWVLYTMREGKLLDEALEWLREYGLVPDTVNDNFEDLKKDFNNNPRKVFANVYIDDHNPFSVQQQISQIRKQYGIGKVHPFQKHETTKIEVTVHIDVDRKIADLIWVLNWLSCGTRYSCEGDDWEHPGYVMFSDADSMERGIPVISAFGCTITFVNDNKHVVLFIVPDTPKISNFFDDEEKMKDFRELSEDEFLASYSYLTREEYALTVKKTLECYENE